MRHGIPPAGHPSIPSRAFFPVTPLHRNAGASLDAPHGRAGQDAVRFGGAGARYFVGAAERAIDAFAAASELTERRAAQFEAAGAGFLEAVATLRAERHSRAVLAQRTQLALEDFAPEIDQLGEGRAGARAIALTALIGELQAALDAAFRPPTTPEAPPIDVPANGRAAVAASKFFVAYERVGPQDEDGNASASDGAIDTVA